MKKEQVLNLMSTIPPDLIEESDIQAPAKHRLPGLARAGLIAACLCLALVGVGAAAVVHGWVRVSEINSTQVERHNGDMVSITEVGLVFDGKAYVPWESFSQQCRDYVNSFLGMPQYKGFDSWDELEEFLGLNIVDNPLLDQAEPVMHTNNSSLGSRTEEGSCFAGFHGRNEAPEFMWLTASYRLKDAAGESYSVHFEADIITEPSIQSEWGASGYRFTSIGGDALTVEPETYVTPSGLQAVIITINYGGVTHYLASFQLNNAKCELYVSGADDSYFASTAPDPEQVMNIVKEILDAFS